MFSRAVEYQGNWQYTPKPGSQIAFIFAQGDLTRTPVPQG
jgi:hypothetical protein